MRKKTSLDSYYRSLRRNMVLIIILVSFAPMILLSALILIQFRGSYHEKVHAHLAELVLKHKQNIDAFLKEKLGDIRVLGRTFDYDEMSDEAFLKERLEILQMESDPVFVDLGVINDKGIQVAYAGPFKLGKALYSSADWFRESMQRDFFISDVFLGLRGLPHFIITVRDHRNGEPWILRATIDFAAFNNLVENIRIGETGFAFILNKKGEFQTKPRMDIAIGKGPYMDFLKSDGKTDKGIKIANMTDDSGRNNIYVASFLKERDWLLVYQQHAADAFSDLNRAMKIALVILIISGLAILVVAVLLSGRMVNRIARADREKQMMDKQIIETAKLASLGELAAGIAHEINNPVAIMVEEAGWIEDLMDDEDFRETKNLDEFKRALGQIRNQGRRCKEITHKLLSFARKTDSRIQKVDINALIEEIISLSAQRAKYSNVTVKTHLNAEIPLLEVSYSELQQVFLNLLNNALDAMDKKGGLIEIKSDLMGGDVVCDVKDNGPGIPQSNIGRIFDPFFTTKPVGKGTGLGLSICYGIIKKMGGTIEVDSVVDVGTLFRIRIPLEGKV